MAKSKEPHPDQHKEFAKAARELGCDESEEAFDKMLKRLASSPPPKSVQRRKADMERRKKMVLAGKKPKPKR